MIKKWGAIPQKFWDAYTNKPRGERVDFILKNVRQGPVLDLGCGPGYIALRLAYFFPVLGVDIDEKYIQSCIEGEGHVCPPYPAKFWKGDFFDIKRVEDLLPGGVKTVVFADVIEHFYEHDHGKVVCKIGSWKWERLIITTPCEGVMMPGETADHRSNLNRERLMVLVEGFDSVVSAEHVIINSMFQGLIVDRKGG